MIEGFNFLKLADVTLQFLWTIFINPTQAETLREGLGRAAALAVPYRNSIASVSGRAAFVHQYRTRSAVENGGVTNELKLGSHLKIVKNVRVHW